MLNKVLLLSIFVVLLTAVPSHAFWSLCSANMPGPDHVSSPNCGATSCTVVRGQMMHADVTISSPYAHGELMVRGFVFLLGIGIPLPQIPP
jgi:hypothetical protein